MAKGKGCGSRGRCFGEIESAIIMLDKPKKHREALCAERLVFWRRGKKTLQSTIFLSRRKASRLRSATSRQLISLATLPRRSFK